MYGCYPQEVVMVFRVGQRVVFKRIPRHAIGMPAGIPEKKSRRVVEIKYSELRHWSGCPNPLNCACMPHPDDQLVRLEGMDDGQMVSSTLLRPED